MRMNLNLTPKKPLFQDIVTMSFSQKEKNNRVKEETFAIETFL